MVIDYEESSSGNHESQGIPKLWFILWSGDHECLSDHPTNQQADTDFPRGAATVAKNQNNSWFHTQEATTDYNLIDHSFTQHQIQ